MADIPVAFARSERIRKLIKRLFREGTMVARSDGSVPELFQVSVSSAEGARRYASA